MRGRCGNSTARSCVSAAWSPRLHRPALLESSGHNVDSTLRVAVRQFEQRAMAEEHTARERPQFATYHAERAAEMEAHATVLRGLLLRGRGVDCARQLTDLRVCSARAAPMAVLTCFLSSGGGSTALMPSDCSHSSRHQPLV